MGGMFSDLKKLQQGSLPSAPRTPVQESTSPRNRGTAQTRNSTSAEERNRASAQPRRATSTPAVPSEPPAEFDLTVRPYKAHGFLWTDEELWALEDIKQDFKRRHGIETSMQELIRVALHFLVNDYRANGEKSFATRSLSQKHK